MSSKSVQNPADCPIDALRLLEDKLNTYLAASPAALYHLQSGGARTRAKICIEASFALSLPINDALCLASTVELLHNASLVHDDLQDNDSQRRGRASVWKVFGKDIALCTGDLMLSQAYCSLAELSHPNRLPALLTLVCNSVANTIYGQCKDMRHSCHDLAEYEKIAAAKSGPLLQLPLILPLVATGYGNDIVKSVAAAIEKFAIAYQIIDDINDWEADKRNEHLNVVNLIAVDTDTRKAIALAKTRAQYLLKKCEVELQKLPANCGNAVIQVSQHLLNEVRRENNE